MCLVAVLPACAMRQDERSAPRAERGLPQQVAAQGETVAGLDSAIWYVFHAKNGDYWFGSNGHGVYRYDGRSLVNFTTRDGLASNQIRGIQEDAAGVVYFTTYAGISAFDGHALAPLPVAESSAPGDWVLRPDDLWFVAGQDSGAVYRYDGQQLHRLTFPSTAAGDAHLALYPRSKYPNAKFSPYDVYTIVKDRQGNVWFGTASLGACRYDGKTFAWLPDSELHNGSFGTRSIVEDRDGRFWFGSSSHRYRVELGEASAPAFAPEVGLRDAGDPSRPTVDGILSSLVDRAGVLWMASYGDGVWRYDGKNTTHYVVRDGDEPITLFTIHEDNHGVLWLGTHEAGAYRFTGEGFERFRL